MSIDLQRICLHIFILIGLDSITVHTTEISAECGSDVTLPCKYETPASPYTRTTIDWRMEKPNNEDPTLVTTSDFKVTGVVSKRYSALSDGSLTIQNVTFEDIGSYKCIVVFRLVEPIDGNGYRTEVDRAQLHVKSSIDQVLIYPKGITENRIRNRRQEPTLVCRADHSRLPAAKVLQWDFDNPGADPPTKKSYYEEHTSDGKMVVFSELTFRRPSKKRSIQWYNVSCSAVEEDEMIMTSSVQVYVDRRRVRLSRRRRRWGKSRRRKTTRARPRRRRRPRKEKGRRKQKRAERQRETT
ncbi:uncharacterized protein [Ptychodera flava]|uniref:uncharacterized protein n=1 Tax=Ptychodera flava TaxID=63121 RepID=UPI003969DE12